MRIALVQYDTTDSKEENIERGLRALTEAARNGAELIAYPELAFTRFFPQKRGAEGSLEGAETIPGPTTDRFCRAARDHGVVTILNLYEVEGDNRFDASPVIDADGSLLGTTRMVHIMEGTCYFERDYYDPGDRGAPVYSTTLGKIGVAICYDRHFPEYMRALGLKGAELVVIPQAGAVDEWPPGVFEAEVQVASLQNGYFAALANRVGEEECLTFAGESFVTDPRGQVISRAPRGVETILYADLERQLLLDCPARQHFLCDRRPDIYPL